MFSRRRVNYYKALKSTYLACLKFNYAILVRYEGTILNLGGGCIL